MNVLIYVTVLIAINFTVAISPSLNMMDWFISMVILTGGGFLANVMDNQKTDREEELLKTLKKIAEKNTD